MDRKTNAKVKPGWMPDAPVSAPPLLGSSAPSLTSQELRVRMKFVEDHLRNAAAAASAERGWLGAILRGGGHAPQRHVEDWKTLAKEKREKLWLELDGLIKEMGLLMAAATGDRRLASDEPATPISEASRWIIAALVQYGVCVRNERERVGAPQWEEAPH